MWWVHLRAVDNLLLEGGPRQRQDVGHDRVEDEVVVAAQLGAREGRHALQQQLRRALDVPSGDEVERLVNLSRFQNQTRKGEGRRSRNTIR